MKKLFLQFAQWFILTLLWSMILPAFALIIWCITMGGFNLLDAFHDPTFMAIEGFIAVVAAIAAGIYVEQEL